MRLMLMMVLAIVLGTAWQGWAHHKIPPGRFQETLTEIQGVVTEVRWANPHVWVFVDVKGDKGETQIWPLEGASPATLEQMGLRADSVKVGDTVKARCRRAVVVTAHHDCILGFLKTRDGSARDWAGGNAAVPAGF